MKRSLESPEPKEAKRLKPCPEISGVTCESTWRGGQSQLITWKLQGDVPGVKLKLQDERDFETFNIYDGRNLPITTNLSAGSCLVTVPRGMTPGTYRVKVQSTASDAVHAHSGYFRIDEDRAPPALSAVTTGIEWTGGTRQLVTWSYQGDVPTVELHLCQANETSMIARGTSLHAKFANEGSFVVIAPTGLPPGGYRVRVRSPMNHGVYSFSEALQLNQGVPPAILDVATSENWEGGTLQQITWRHQGSVRSVMVSLWADGMKFWALGDERVMILHWRHSNSGSCSITVPTGFPPGAYRVKVQSSDYPAVSGTSRDLWIDRGCTPPEIMDVTTSQRIWHSASHQRITWRHRGAVPLVGVYLCTKVTLSGGGLRRPHVIKRTVKTLQSGVENLGSCSVTVPSGLPPGTYHVEVLSSSARPIKASSADILIDDDHRERCVRYALGLLGLRRPRRLPYSVVKKIAVMAATE